MFNWHLGYVFSFPDTFTEKDLTLLIALLSRIGRPGLAQSIEVPCTDISALTNTHDLETHKIVCRLMQTYPCITATVGEVDAVSGSAYTKIGPLFIAASRQCAWGSGTEKPLKTDTLVLVPNSAILQHLELTHGIRCYYDLIHQLMEDYVLFHGPVPAETLSGK